MRLWGETDPAVWRAWAARAPEAGCHLEAVGRAPGLPELDAWAVEVLPVLVRERWAVDGELGLTPEHFMRIMQWEALRAGRPPPAAEVRDVDKILRASTRRAFSALPLKFSYFSRSRVSAPHWCRVFRISSSKDWRSSQHLSESLCAPGLSSFWLELPNAVRCENASGFTIISFRSHPFNNALASPEDRKTTPSH